jgi:hypothetical protein
MTIESTAHDHASLVHRLGGAACLVPVPANGHDLLEVGMFAGLPCWSAVGDAATTRRLAQQLARRGAVGLLLVDHPEHPTRFTTPTIEPIRVSAIPRPGDTSLPLRRLARVRHVESPLATAIACAAALDVDAAGRQTFSTMHALLDRAITALPPRVPIGSRHAWSLLQLTRLLFLRFVESEGWLDQNPTFLAEQFDDCLRRRRDPQRALLAPLFFGTLNRPAASRSLRARSFGRIPFLNGGLFEPHALERRHALHLPTPFWREAVDSLILRTEVTLVHDELDGRVTPEMLGRVFEGVMSPDERKRDGTFFTPPALVAALLREAATPHFAYRLQRTEGEVARQLDDPDPVLQAMMVDTTVLDPAVGSGAFLVGALDLLHGPGPRVRRRVRHLISQRLFGVDRNPAAVRLTELRLWLELLRAMRGTPIARIVPLPNLQASIRAGDALLDPELPTLSAPLMRGLRTAQLRFVRAHGATKRERLRTLQRAEEAAFREAMQEREGQLDRAIRELVLAQRGPTLFGEAATMQRVDRDRLASLHEAHRQVRRELRRLADGTASAPFAMATALAPVLSGRGGFDLVVGNPPWVRAERLPPEMRVALAARYRWWRVRGTQGFRHLPDLAVAFVERSLDLLAPHGTAALLVPAKLTTAGYAVTARAELAERTTLHVVADLSHDPRAGFEATTYPLALITSRRRAPSGHVVRMGLLQCAEQHEQRDWTSGGPWLLTTRDGLAVAHRLARSHPTLHESFAPQLGVKTGANAAFLDPPPSLAPWCRMAVRGRDVRAFTVTPRHRLLWPADASGEPMARLPLPLADHLADHAGMLQRRSDLTEGPWWRLFRVRAATAPHRVVWGDLARRLEAAALVDPAWIPLNSCYVIVVRDAREAAALTAWLNSSWIRALARLRAEPAAGGAARFGARAVGGVPWDPRILDHDALGGLTDSAEDTARLDTLVAQTLGLDARDCAALAPLAARRR